MPLSQEEMIEFLRKIVGMKTVEGALEAQEQCLLAIAEKVSGNLFVQRFSFRKRPIMVLSNTTSREVDFILAGHVDVVPAENSQFQLKIEKGKLFGRGVFDMKGPLIAGIFAVNDFLKENKGLKVAIFITADEEIDGLSVNHLLESEGYKADFAIIPDGGKEAEIVREQKGFLQIKMKVFGKSAHASRPWEAGNPIIKGLDVVNKLLKKFEQPISEQDWKNSIVLTKIEAGKALNQIPEECDIYLDIRYISEEYKDQILKEIKNILKDSGDIEIVAENGLFRIPEDNTFLKLLVSSIEEKSQHKVKLVQECATSDAVFFTQNNVSAVLFRPKGGGSHAKDEWVDKESFFLFYEMLLDFLRKFNSTK